MRRGFMKWDPAEITPEALQARATRLQAEMQKAGLDGMVIYTNFIRPSAVCYYTAFTPYWADAILLVPLKGEPVFATALSKRVSSWINSVKPVGELVNTPDPGKIVGERLKAAKAARVGILELDRFPAKIYDDLAATAPDVSFVDGSETFIAARRDLDGTEIALLARSNALAAEGLAKVGSNATSVGAALGPIEQFVRLNGGEEIYMGVAPDLARDRRFMRLSGPGPLAERFAIRASTSYKGAWVRRTLTFDKDAGEQSSLRAADAWFESFLRDLKPGLVLERQIVDAVTQRGDAVITNWLAESCVGTDPFSAVASRRAPTDYKPAEGSFLVLTLELTIGGKPWVGAAPVVVGRDVFARRELAAAE